MAVPLVVAAVTQGCTGKARMISDSDDGSKTLQQQAQAAAVG